MKQSHPLPHDKANVIDFSERKSNQKNIADRKDKDYLAARRKVHAAAALLTW